MGLLGVGIGDGSGTGPVWRWAGVANVASILVFLACAATLTVRRRP